MPEPLEIVYSPAEVYVAPLATTFPLINVAPAAAWVRLGTLGPKNQTEAGVIIRRSREMARFYSAGSTVARKLSVTQDSFQVEFTLADMNPEEMALAFGADPLTAITDTAASSGVAGHQSFAVPVSPVPTQKAMLVRVDQSPFGAGWNTQFEIRNAVQSGAPEGSFNKNEPFALQQVWEAVEDASGFVTVRYQDAAPT